MKKMLLVLLLLTSIALNAYNQVINGTVMDKQTKGKLVFAAVYFSGSFTGTHTDKNGNFVLNISGHGTMPITVSALGYYSETVTNLPVGQPLKIYLKPKVFELKEVVINAKSREKNLKMFKENFLGTSANAIRCEITNENDIKITFENDTLKAYASKPIQIINRGLGYKELYYLDKFWFYPKRNAFLISGNMVFNEDLISDNKKKEFYLLSRERAYKGSRMHFFRALWGNTLLDEGFSLKNVGKGEILYSNIVVSPDSTKKYLRSHGMLGIYDHMRASTSWISIVKDYVYFDERGYFDPFGISWDGPMAIQRVGDMLPYEYSAKQ